MLCGLALLSNELEMITQYSRNQFVDLERYVNEMN